MRLVPSDCVWGDTTMPRPLPPVRISMAEEPNARDATARCQEICEGYSRGIGPPTQQERGLMRGV
jgi:hypothetical protein